MTPLVFDTRPFEVLFTPPNSRAEPTQSILHYPQSGPSDFSFRRNGAQVADEANQSRNVRFGISEIRVFEMLEPEYPDAVDAVLMEKSKDKKSKAAAQDELKELLARKQEEYKKLQAEKQKNKGKQNEY